MEPLETKRLMSGFAGPEVHAAHLPELKIPGRVVEARPPSTAAAATRPTEAAPSKGVAMPAAIPQAAASSAAVTGYVLNPNDHTIHRRFANGTYQQIGGQATQLVQAGLGVYGLNGTVHQVFSWGGSSWTRIGDQATQIVEAGDKLYGLNGVAHATYVYNGSPQNWTRIGDETAQIAAAGDRLYGLNGNNHAVYVYNGSPQNWTIISDGNVKQIVAAGDRLYAVTDSNHLFRYDGGGRTGWTPLRGDVNQVVSTADGWLVVLRGADDFRRGVRGRLGNVERLEANGTWTTLGLNVAQIATDAGRLIALSGANVIRYDYNGGRPQWTRIGSDVTQILSDSGQLIAYNARYRTADRYDGGGLGRWTTVGSSITEIAGDSGVLTVLSGTDVLRYDGKLDNNPPAWARIGTSASRIFTSAGRLIAENNAAQRFRYDINKRDFSGYWTRIP